MKLTQKLTSHDLKSTVVTIEANIKFNFLLSILINYMYIHVYNECTVSSCLTLEIKSMLPDGKIICCIHIHVNVINNEQRSSSKSLF